MVGEGESQKVGADEGVRAVPRRSRLRRKSEEDPTSISSRSDVPLQQNRSTHQPANCTPYAAALASAPKLFKNSPGSTISVAPYVILLPAPTLLAAHSPKFPYST